MPSPLIVPVAEISKIAPHPNADALEIAQVLGWQCVVQKDRYRAGDKVVYFAPDTVLPKDLSDAWGVTQYLDKQRVKATRLRGEPSFGLVMPCVHDYWEVGQNVADYFGATKYEPPVRPQHGGKSIDNLFGLPRDPLFPEYTHIQNLRHFPDLIGDDELVVVTEKLHGTNSRIGIVDGQWMAGSHKVRRGEGDALYWSPKSHIEALCTALSKHHRQVIVFGEILGGDVQSLDYGYAGYEGYRAFDVMIDGRYLDYQSFAELCRSYRVATVPLLYDGPFALGVARHYAQGGTALRDRVLDEAPRADHLREGVVVKPLIERHDPKIGRCVLKYVSDDFLLAKKSDFSEV